MEEDSIFSSVREGKQFHFIYFILFYFILLFLFYFLFFANSRSTPAFPSSLYVTVLFLATRGARDNKPNLPGDGGSRSPR